MLAVAEARRTWFPETSIANLNAGTTSPTPLPVLSVANAWREKLSRDPVGVIWLSIIKEIEVARTALGNYLQVPTEQLLLFGNTTMGINTIAQSLKLSAGDEILLTDQEYHHYEPLWRKVCASAGAKLVRVHLPRHAESTPADIVELFTEKWTAQTKVLFTSHVTSQTGIALPVGDLCQLARARGTTSIIDGAHAPGLIPVSPQDLDCDFYAGNIHKWLMGAVGSAFLYVRADKRSIITPLVMTGESDYMAAQTHQRKGEGWPTYWQYSFEYQGTQDRSALVAIPEALALREQIGEDAIQEQVRANRRQLRQRMQERDMKCLSADDPALATAMVTAALPQDIDRIEAWVWMRDHGFDVAFPSWDERIMRISGAWFVTSEQIDRCFEIWDQSPWGT